MAEAVPAYELSLGDVVKVGGSVTEWELVVTHDAGAVGLIVLHLQPVLAGPEIEEPIECGPRRSVALPSSLEIQRRTPPRGPRSLAPADADNGATTTLRISP